MFFGESGGGIGGCGRGGDLVRNRNNGLAMINISLVFVLDFEDKGVLFGSDVFKLDFNGLDGLDFSLVLFGLLVAHRIE